MYIAGVDTVENRQSAVRAEGNDIPRALYGTIEVDSELGKGTTFTLNFPIPTKL